MEYVIELISNLGFPIAVCAYLLHQNAKEQERHREEANGFMKALENNTIALEKILTKLGDSNE